MNYRFYSFHKVGKESLSISIISFGYKYGIPMDADLVFDVRFLPNPHYVSSFKELTGEKESGSGIYPEMAFDYKIL